MLNFSTKTAIVTGGSRGIGKEISLILAQNNFNVVAVATSEKSLDSIRDIENIHPFCSDISNEKSIEKLYEFVISKFGHADVLVNNAGIHMDNILLRMKSEEWNQVMNVNLNGPFHLTKTVLKDMVKNKNGRIINISSISGTDGNKGQGNYAASKGGLLALTKSLAKELAPNIRVNAISPGAITWPDGMDGETKENIINQTVLKKMGDAKDIAKTVIFLIEDASYITGQILNVDGGKTLFL